MDSIDKITLQYLLNPNVYDKINTNKEDKDYDLEKYQKYKNKILNLTEEMLNNKFVNDQLKEEFNNYCKNLIYHIKNEELKNIIQDDYKDFEPKNKKKLLIDISNITLNDLSLNAKNILNKSKKHNDLNSFIIKNNNKSKSKILPKKKNLDDI
jgi:hypothetical protein